MMKCTSSFPCICFIMNMLCVFTFCTGKIFQQFFDVFFAFSGRFS